VEEEEDVDPPDFESLLVELIVFPFDAEFPELFVDELLTVVLLVLY